MIAVQGLSMDFDEIKEEEGPKMEINELDVDEREKLVTIGVLDEVVERVKMEADEKSVEFRKRYDERMEALNNVIAQLFAMERQRKSEQTNWRNRSRSDYLRLKPEHYTSPKRFERTGRSSRTLQTDM